MAFDERAFQEWYKKWAEKTGINPNPDDPKHFYDYKLAFGEGVEPTKNNQGVWKWPSKFKLEGHPTYHLKNNNMAKTPLEEIFNQESKEEVKREALKSPLFGKVFDKEKPSLEEYEQNFMEQIGEEVFKPFAKVTGTILSAGRGAYKFSEAGIRYLMGDKEGAMSSVIEAGQPFKRDLGFYGKLGSIEPLESTQEAIGSGAQIASYFIGFQEGKAYTDMLKNSGVVSVLKNYWARIAMREGVAGSIEEMGRAVSGGENDPEEIITKGAVGGVFGAIGGIASVPIFAGIRNVWNFIRKGGAQFTKEIIDEAVEEGTGEAVKKNPFIRTVLGEDVDISASSMLENDKKIARFFDVDEDLVKSGRTIITQDVPISSLDEPVQKLLNAGIGDNEVNLMMQASDQDLVVFNNMLESAKASQKTWRTQRRPVEYVGDAVLDRVKHINGQTKVYSEALDDIVKGMPDKPIDVTDVYNNFMEKLGDDISVGANGKLDFGISKYSGTKSGSVRDTFQEVYDLIKPGKNDRSLVTPERIRTIRQQLFDTLNLAKQQKVSLPESDYIANSVRKELHQIMGGLSDKYASTSLKLAQMIELNKEFYRLIGRDWVGEEMISLRSGEVMNRILGNASAKPLNTLSKLETIARQTGFDDGLDVEKLVIFNDRLEDLFGTTQTRSLGGQVERAGGRAISQLTKDLSGPGSLTKKILRFGGSSLEMLSGTGDKDKINALTEFINWKIK